MHYNIVPYCKVLLNKQSIKSGKSKLNSSFSQFLKSKCLVMPMPADVGH